MAASNVLILLSDEHSAQAMGQHSLAHTPHLDTLAKRGTRFANAYSPSPICVPARASLATGRYVHQHSCWDNAIAYTGSNSSWGHRLQEHAIAVESIGKLHYADAVRRTGFDRQHLPMHIQNGIGQVWGSVRNPLPETGPAAGLFTQLGAGESSYNRYDRSVAAQAINWLEAAAGQRSAPWVLFVGFVAPHFPLIVPPEYLQRYPLDLIPLPKQHPQNGYRRHPWVEELARFSQHDEEIGSDERRRLALASYLALITFLDEQVGLVLNTLDRLGLSGDTTVIYSSDHGDNMGARGMWNKSTLYRESTGIPMILAGPGIPENRVCRTNVSLVDIYPTVLQATGTPAAAQDSDLPGRALGEIANAPDEARIVFSEYHAVGSGQAAYMISDGRFKYHHYIAHPPELFDLDLDPEELHDLSQDPAYGDTLARLESRLRSILDPDEVNRAALADQAALVERFGGRLQALATGTPGATPPPAAS